MYEHKGNRIIAEKISFVGSEESSVFERQLGFYRRHRVVDRVIVFIVDKLVFPETGQVINGGEKK